MAVKFKLICHLKKWIISNTVPGSTAHMITANNPSQPGAATWWMYVSACLCRLVRRLIGGYKLVVLPSHTQSPGGQTRAVPIPVSTTPDTLITGQQTSVTALAGRLIGPSTTWYDREKLYRIGTVIDIVYWLITCGADHNNTRCHNQSHVVLISAHHHHLVILEEFTPLIRKLIKHKVTVLTFTTYS